jgi:hypothetical protein
MIRSLEYELPEDPDSVVCEMGEPTALYSLRHVSLSADGDEFVLEANPDALRRLARLLAQLADRGEGSSFHVHIGASSEEAPQGPGWRILATKTPVTSSDEPTETVARDPEILRNEAHRATEMLRDKVVAKILRPRAKTVGLAFRDGTRLYVDHQSEQLELSIEGGMETRDAGA